MILIYRSSVGSMPKLNHESCIRNEPTLRDTALIDFSIMVAMRALVNPEICQPWSGEMDPTSAGKELSSSCDFAPTAPSNGLERVPLGVRLKDDHNMQENFLCSTEKRLL